MQVIAILAIFFAIELEVSGLERMTTWVVVSYVGFHVVTHTLLTINMCWSDNTSDNMGSSSQIYPVTRYSGTKENWRLLTSAAKRLIGEVVQSRRRPLLGPSPG